MTNECWKIIEDYPNYMVSDQGRIMNIKRGKCLRPFPNTDGYLVLSLTKDKKQRQFRVNRLVALAFVPNPDNLPEVNHDDEDKLNNFASNFTWMTKQQNSEYSKAISCVFIDPDGNKVEVYNINKFSRENGLRGSSMHAVAKGKYNSHKGWKI